MAHGDARTHAHAYASSTGGAEYDEAAIEDERYVPTSAAGSRLPHHWLHRRVSNRARATDMPVISTHDLLHDAVFVDDASIPAGLPNATPPRLTLLVDCEGAQPWSRAVAKLAATQEAARTLRVVAVAGGAGRGVSDALDADPSCPVSDLGGGGYGRGRSDWAASVEIVDDPSGEWPTKRQVEWDGAILVRPDGHVAWRCVALNLLARAPHLLERGSLAWADAAEAEAEAQLLDAISSSMAPQQ